MLLVFVLLAVVVVGAGWRVTHGRERETANPPRPVEVRPLCVPEPSVPGVSDAPREARIAALAAEIEAVGRQRQRADLEFFEAMKRARP